MISFCITSLNQIAMEDGDKQSRKRTEGRSCRFACIEPTPSPFFGDYNIRALNTE
jgi:hypothetical protein